MSIESASRAGLPPPPVDPGVSARPLIRPSATPEGEPALRLERPQLHQAEKVDLGFRTDEMRKNMKEAVTRLNEQMEGNGRHLRFSLDEDIHRAVITVKNRQTGEVVRQIPTEVAVKMAHSIEDLKGLLFDEQL